MKRHILRKNILDNAWEILKRDGLEEVSIRELAKLSQCSLGSIYNAFENYDDILFHLNARTLDLLYGSLIKEVKDSIKKGCPLKKVVHNLGRSYILFSKENSHLWKALFETSAKDSLPDWYRERVRLGVAKLKQKMGEAFPAEKERVSKLLFYWAAIHGISSATLNKKLDVLQDNVDDAYVDSYIEYCLEGFVT